MYSCNLSKLSKSDLRERQSAIRACFTNRHRIYTPATYTLDFAPVLRTRSGIMAGKRLRQNGTWEYVFKRKGVLDGPIYFTFDTEEEGDCYAAKAEALLAQGIVPPEMLEGSLKTLGDLCALYGASVPMAESEAELLPTLQKLTQSVRIERLSYAWAEGLVDDLKTAGRAPAPSPSGFPGWPVWWIGACAANCSRWSQTRCAYYPEAIAPTKLIKTSYGKASATAALSRVRRSAFVRFL